MYNKKSKISATLTIITALLLVGLMVLLPSLRYQQKSADDWGGIALFFIIAYGYPAIYLGGALFVIIALFSGIKMLKQQSRKKLIYSNVRMLIVSIILLPVLAFGLALSSGLIFQSTFGLFPKIYTIVVSLFYIVGLVARIVTIAKLKKLPEENVTTITE